MKLEELNKAFEEQVSKEETVEEVPEKKRKKRWIILLAVVLMLGCSAFALNQQFNHSSLPDAKEVEVAEGGLIAEIPDDMKKGEYGDLLQQKIDDSMFTINVRSTPVFTNGTARGTIDIVNNPSNKFPCMVVLTLDETGDEVYRCDDLIYPGQYINEIRLEQNLKKGAYPATLTYYVYDETGEESVGIINAGITIAIQN
ncbi:hypothetical protein DWX43_16980 [Clostridium sp. AF19-22AC]|jgi:hypothetical protein|uniref:hypothetical protein n=1 Tax=Clostridia TaxID=186801 RepID=UPI000E48FD3E|nr:MULTISPECIES: hypothetical protein [Clostridia]RHR25819.1 hypothetical protein DWX43_16980 [Clostridium sp. AF19-22AC]